MGIKILFLSKLTALSSGLLCILIPILGFIYCKKQTPNFNFRANALSDFALSDKTSLVFVSVMVFSAISLAVFLYNLFIKFKIKLKSKQGVLAVVSILSLAFIGIIKPTEDFTFQYLVHESIAFTFFVSTPLMFRYLVEYLRPSLYRTYSRNLLFYNYTVGVILMLSFHGLALSETNSIVSLFSWVLYTLVVLFIPTYAIL